jgi:two-component system, cell cycle sensor histidine kinase and response regulator CckA
VTGVPDGADTILDVDQGVRQRTETILLVEDEAFVREVTAEVLKSAGYKVLTSKSAGEAVGAYEEALDHIDLLLTDVVLPGESGRTLARKLRSHDPSLPVLLITGYGEQMAMSGTEAEGMQCLPKPFSAPILLKKVQQILDGRKTDAGECRALTRACGIE